MMTSRFCTGLRSAVLAALPLFACGAAALAQESMTVREDAEGAAGLIGAWDVYDAIPPGQATCAVDPTNPANHVVRLLGDGPVQTDTGYRLTFSPAETTQFKVQTPTRPCARSRPARATRCAPPSRMVPSRARTALRSSRLARSRSWTPKATRC